ncbi:MAG: PIG-L deacetylase family protein [Candidatus Brocadiia bacterium]
MSGPLVAVAAHADDAELNAGGTLAKWVAGGGTVHIVMVTNNCSGACIPEGDGEKHARRLPPDQTMAIRRREQEAAAALLGASLHTLDYCQRHYWDGEREVSEGYGGVRPPQAIASHPPLLIAFLQPDHIRRLSDLLVSLRPERVLTQTPIDLDPEHHAVAAMVWRAFRQRKRELGSATLRFWTPGSSCQDGMLDPGYDHIEDVSDHYATKLALCRCHASQMTRTRLDMVRRRATLWGRRLGVRYAEPFRTANL